MPNSRKNNVSESQTSEEVQKSKLTVTPNADADEMRLAAVRRENFIVVGWITWMWTKNEWNRDCRYGVTAEEKEGIQLYIYIQKIPYVCHSLCSLLSLSLSLFIKRERCKTQKYQIRVTWCATCLYVRLYAYVCIKWKHCESLAEFGLKASRQWHRTCER